MQLQIDGLFTFRWNGRTHAMSTEKAREIVPFVLRYITPEHMQQDSVEGQRLLEGMIVLLLASGVEKIDESELLDHMTITEQGFPEAMRALGQLLQILHTLRLP